MNGVYGALVELLFVYFSSSPA